MPRNPGNDDPDIHRHRNGPCGGWAEAEKRLFHSLLFYRTPTLQAALAAADRLYEAFPDSHRYEKQSISNYINSEHFSGERQQLEEEIRETAPKRGFAIGELRISALSNQASRIHEALALIPDSELLAKAAPAQKLLSEFRSYLGEIRDEVSRLGGTVSEGVTSLAQSLADQEKRIKTADGTTTEIVDIGDDIDGNQTN